METIGRIISQSPLQTVETRNREGKTEMLSILGFELQSGSDRLYAEMYGEQAMKCATLSQQYYYKVELRASVRTTQTQDGKEFRRTSLRIQNIELL